MDFSMQHGFQATRDTLVFGGAGLLVKEAQDAIFIALLAAP